MEFSKAKNFLTSVLLLFIVVGAGFFIVKDWHNFFLGAVSLSQQTPKTNESQVIKAIYMTGWSTGNSSYYNYLDDLLKKTQINAVVIDIKDASGYVFYNSDAPEVKKYGFYNGAIKDISGIINFFHDRNIYVIGRIVVFQDPMYAKVRPDLAIYDTSKTAGVFSGKQLWQDNKGQNWLDPTAKEVWDYNISLAKDAALKGFDEINFDYIRFPSDGDLSTMGFPAWNKTQSRREALKGFYKYINEQLQDVKISADLFGLVTVNNDDLGIGQYLEDTLPYFDFICPMVYPSHYATNFLGFSNPAEHPYEVVKHSSEISYYRRQIFLTRLKIALEQEKKLNPGRAPVTQVFAAKIRPWLQDFNLEAVYTADMVKSQIEAVERFYKDDYVGFMLWNPSNYYTKEAVLK